jgi:hypothetical protein
MRYLWVVYVNLTAIKWNHRTVTRSMWWLL